MEITVGKIYIIEQLDESDGFYKCKEHFIGKKAICCGEGDFIFIDETFENPYPEEDNAFSFYPFDSFRATEYIEPESEYQPEQFNAAKARSIAEGHTKYNLQTILEEIEMAAANGNYAFEITGAVSVSIIEDLEKLGFTVEKKYKEFCYLPGYLIYW